MSVLRDAKDLGYGLDHFMITGENFPPEWQNDFHEHSNNEKNDENVHGGIDFIKTSTKKPTNHIDEYIHEHVRRYDSYNDYITYNDDNHNYYDSHRHHYRNKTQKTINAAGKTITNEMLDITEYIRNIDISEARRQGIIIKSIRYQAHPIERGSILDANIEQWIKNEKVLLDQRAWSVRYSEKERNERNVRGKANHIVIERTFSNFKIITKTGYSSSQYYLMFGELDGSKQYAEDRKHPRYNPKGTPTMIQIAFGLIKKYEKLKVEIRGYIPGINEPAE